MSNQAPQRTLPTTPSPDPTGRSRYPSWAEMEPAFETERLAAAHPRPRPRPRRRRPFPRWLIAPAALVALLLLALGAALYIEGRSQGKILDNVYIAGVAVGGMSPADAEASLRLRYEQFQAYPITLVYDDRVWRPRGSDIGLEVDWTYAISEALTIGHSGPFLARWQQRFKSWTDRYDLLLPLRLDQNRLQSYLEEIARELDVPPQDAALSIQGQQVSVQLGHAGRALEIVPSLYRIREALQVLARTPVPLTVRQTAPGVDDEAIESARHTAEQMLAGPLTLHLGDRSWTLTIDKIGQMIRIEQRQEGSGPPIAVVLDQAALRQFLEQIGDEVRVHPRNAHFRFVEDRLQITDAGAPGVELQVERGIAQINEAILSPQRDVTLSLLVVQPKIREETLDELGIRGVVGVGHTTFAGSSAARAHNILTAARILDGTLIPPGETFSFIGTIGAIDESDGFVPGYSIVAGRTVLAVGGGVCQVSTTVFRAAFWAGLPITERHAHNFRVRWYEYDAPLGMDAAIFTDTGTDLKFTNNTTGYLLLQFEAYTATGDLYAYLYGTPQKYEVTLDGPYLSNWTPAPTDPVYVDNPNLPVGYLRQTDWAQGGVDCTIYRRILLNGQEVSSDTFFSRYQAWPNIFERGTGAP